MKISPQCHLIAVMGGKGGVGKSVFAANFAAALMLELRAQVLLLDADAKSCGDQNVILGLKPNKTIGEVAQYQGSMTQQNSSQIITQHPSGLSYIGAVRGPEELLKPNIEIFMKHLEFLSRQYKFIVADVGSEFQAFQLALLQESTVFFIITSPEILVVNQTHRLIHELLTMTYPMDMFQMIVNKFNPSGGLSPQTIGQSLRLNPLAVIPYDEATTFQSIQRSTPFVLGNNKTPIAAAYHELVRQLTGGILQKLKNIQKPNFHPNQQSQQQNGGEGNNQQDNQAPFSGHGGETLDYKTSLKIRIHNELIKAMDLKKAITDTQGDATKEKKLKDDTLKTITLLVDKESAGLSRDDRARTIKEVLEEALGLGPLEDLIADSNVTEIMVNGHRKIYIEKSGKLQLSPISFTSNQHLLNVIERIVTPLGRRVDTKTPYVDARLKDGSRVNAIIEPLAIDGHSLTIRKFKKGGITPEKYIEYQSVDKKMISFLKLCVENGMNIVVSGGTGSGKTSLLNMISTFIPSNERILTVEDAAELQLQQDHVVRLEARPPSMEGTGGVTIRDLIRNALRMRPNRIIVGECRDGAALDMLQAMSTGHDGSMTTTHANTPRECIARLETLTMMAGMDLPARVIREQIASAVNVIVQISRLSDGSRKVISITEVQGMQADMVTLQEIYRFKQLGYDKNRRIVGKFQSLSVPKFVEKLKEKGVGVPLELFANDEDPTPGGSGALTSAAPGSLRPANPPLQQQQPPHSSPQQPQPPQHHQQQAPPNFHPTGTHGSPSHAPPQAPKTGPPASPPIFPKKINPNNSGNSGGSNEGGNKL